MENDVFLNNVKNYNKKNPVRFHMPGHKGKPIADYQNNLLQYDLTELKETDNLYDPEPCGGIRQMMELCKDHYGTSNTILSAGGATLCIQTAVMSVIRTFGNNRIICDRRCHKSVINALILCNAEPVWIDVTTVTELPVAAAMIVTSPDYYGVMLDIRRIAEMCHKSGIVLICDNAHGSHLAYYKSGDLHAYSNGADMVIDSLHKTLPALTGSALLHANERFREDILLSSLRLFASTSPSYLISASICSCIGYMLDNGSDRLRRLYDEITDCKVNLRNLGYNIIDGEHIHYDPFRLCINLGNAEELYNYLYNNNVVCEFYDKNNVIIIPSVMNTERDFDILYDLCRNFIPAESDSQKYEIYIPESAVSAREAVLLKSYTIGIAGASGKICAETIAPYPPGIPLILPGEIFDDYIVARLKLYGYDKVKITGER